MVALDPRRSFARRGRKRSPGTFCHFTLDFHPLSLRSLNFLPASWPSSVFSCVFKGWNFVFDFSTSQRSLCHTPYLYLHDETHITLCITWHVDFFDGFSYFFTIVTENVTFYALICGTFDFFSHFFRKSLGTDLDISFRLFESDICDEFLQKLLTFYSFFNFSFCNPPPWLTNNHQNFLSYSMTIDK